MVYCLKTQKRSQRYFTLRDVVKYFVKYLEINKDISQQTTMIEYWVFGSNAFDNIV